MLLGSREAGGFVPQSQFLAAGRGVSDADLASREPAPDDLYIMMYTSGTTAEPKGCRLTHRAMVGSGVEVGRDAFCLSESDCMWDPLPMFHVSVQSPMIGVLDAGATFLSMTHFEPETALRTISEEGATFLLCGYPTIAQPILGHPAFRPEMLAKVRAVLIVGPPDMLRSFQESLPYSELLSCYGSTELGGIAVMGRPGDPLEARVTCGKPLPGVELQIRDPDTGQEVPAGQPGVLWARGSTLFAGYHNAPEKMAESFDADGWFNTGDLAAIDDRGNMNFAGRAKDMLEVGGENVACVEVESYLARHPAVALAAVVGIPEAKYGEAPVASVELAHGAEVTEPELIAHCRAGLAKYKVPRAVHFIAEWPMSATKIQKFRLRDTLLAGDAGASGFGARRGGGS